MNIDDIFSWKTGSRKQDGRENKAEKRSRTIENQEKVPLRPAANYEREEPSRVSVLSHAKERKWSSPNQSCMRMDSATKAPGSSQHDTNVINNYMSLLLIFPSSLIFSLQSANWALRSASGSDHNSLINIIKRALQYGVFSRDVIKI